MEMTPAHEPPPQGHMTPPPRGHMTPQENGTGGEVPTPPAPPAAGGVKKQEQA